MSDKLQEDIQKEAAFAANDELAGNGDGRKLLSGNLGEVVLNKYEQAEKLNSELVRDSMTGLYNQAYLVKELDIRINNTKKPFAVIWIDMDNLKTMNDENGHEVGTEVIIGLSRLLENKIRPNENGFVSRYGGDEFVIVIPGMTKIESVMERARDINSSVSATEFRTSKGGMHQTVSLGAGIWDGKESRTELLERVDGAMYDAKKQGRNVVVQAK